MQDHRIAGVPPALSAEREKLTTSSLRSLSDSIQAIQESVPACAICGQFFALRQVRARLCDPRVRDPMGNAGDPKMTPASIFALRAQCGRDARDPDTRDSVLFL